MLRSWKFCSDSSIHGFLHGSQTSSVVGFGFWMLVTATFFSLATWFNAELIKTFINAPTFKSITVAKSYTQGLLYPPLTICYNHRTTNSLLAKANLSIAELEYLTFSLMSINSIMFVNNFHLESLYQQFRNSTKIDFENIETVWKLFSQITPKCEDLVFYSTIAQTRINCCSEAFHQVIINSNGPCLILKFTDVFNQTVSGNAGGIGLIVSLPNAKEYPNATFFTYLMDGIQLFMTPYDALLENNPIYVERGDTAMLEMNLEETFALSTGDCHSEKNITLDRWNGVQNRYYQECLVECKRMERLKRCECLGLSSFEVPKNKTFCTPAKAYECHITLANTSIGTIGLICAQQCKDNCHRLSFSITKSSAPTVRQGMNVGLSREFGLPDNKSATDMSVLYIYYADIRYTIVRESYTQTWQSLLSNMGGIYGLWTGASLVSVVHVLYALSTKILRRRNLRASQNELKLPYFAGQNRY